MKSKQHAFITETENYFSFNVSVRTGFLGDLTDSCRNNVMNLTRSDIQIMTVEHRTRGIVPQAVLNETSGGHPKRP